MPKLINRLGDSVLPSNRVEETLLVTVAIDVDSIVADLPRYKTIEIKFDAFTDGRGYSTAKLLRDRFAFTGELRAVGDVTIDQLFYLARCGFDTFALRDDQDLALAKASLNSFSNSYQKSHSISENLGA
jgi:uncharacterized protein (DUF934 family)